MKANFFTHAMQERRRSEWAREACDFMQQRHLNVSNNDTGKFDVYAVLDLNDWLTFNF